MSIETSSATATDDDLVGRPADGFACGAVGCRQREDLRRVTNGDQIRVLCPSHARDFVGGTNR